VREIQDHQIIPDYPDTDEDGIAHFIHFLEPPFTPETDLKDIKQIFQREIEKVWHLLALSYAKYMLIS
jgi:hypothetical protein